jgi:hypothetical protein
MLIVILFDYLVEFGHWSLLWRRRCWDLGQGR